MGGDVRPSPMAYPAVRSLPKLPLPLRPEAEYLIVGLPVRPVGHQAQSLAIALRSPATKRSSDLNRYSPDIHHFSGTQLWLRAHGSAEKNNRAWCARCMDHFERYWNICAKTACGRVHPVALVTASSRISRN